MDLDVLDELSDQDQPATTFFVLRRAVIPPARVFHLDCEHPGLDRGSNIERVAWLSVLDRVGSCLVGGEHDRVPRLSPNVTRIQPPLKPMTHAGQLTRFAGN